MTPSTESRIPYAGIPEDKLGCGLAGLIFVFPLAGLALYFTERNTRPRRARGAAQMAWAGLVVLLVLLAVLGVVVSRLARSRQDQKELTIACGNNLAKMHRVFKQYAHDNDGKLPDLSNATKVRQVLYTYHYESDIFSCPESQELYEGNAAFSWKKLKQITHPERAVLFYEKEVRHSGGRNVYFADGHVMRLGEAGWRKAKEESEIY